MGPPQDKDDAVCKVHAEQIDELGRKVDRLERMHTRVLEKFDALLSMEGPLAGLQTALRVLESVVSTHTVQIAKMTSADTERDKRINQVAQKAGAISSVITLAGGIAVGVIVWLITGAIGG
jgi:hypothetical protein